MDAHIPRAITVGLRVRGVEVLTAQEDGMALSCDSDLLDRASELSRVFVTFDDDLLREAAQRWRDGVPFGGIIYAHPLGITIGHCVHDLQLVAGETEPTCAPLTPTACLSGRQGLRRSSSYPYSSLSPRAQWH